MSKARVKPFQPPPTVAIGASAGGLEALTRLFTTLRGDLGLAYVVIVHLSPDHESNLPEILQRSTRMPVLTAEQGAAVQADHVYVIPPNAVLSIEGGRLALKPREASAGIAMPIDDFLRSLAADQHRRAVAVILSGAGHDGTSGSKAIKSEGGVVFAQDPASAAQRSMPESVAGAGAADFTLPPEDIARELARLSRHPSLARGAREVDPLLRDETSLRRIFALVRSATGVDFSFYKPTTVGRRLLRRLLVHKLDSLAEYLELLKRDPKEVNTFCEETLIHVTQFFREPEAFAALRERVVPRLLKNGSKNAPIRVWVPGCSTGEEAYSVAIALFDALGDRANVRRLQVFATDVSEATIARARTGIFPDGIREDVPARLLRRFFMKTERGYQVSKLVRDACVFAKQNLIQDPPFANLDLISCRNLLIYLEPSLQRKIIPIFHYSLKPYGALMLGSAETIGGFGSLFSIADKKSRLYFKKAGVVSARLEPLRAERHAMAGRRFRSKEPAVVPASAGGRPGWPESDVQKAADRLLLSRFAPAGVLIDSDLEILQFRGSIHRYLKPSAGKASLNLLKMLPDEWHSSLHALIQRVKKTGETSRQTDLPFKESSDRGSLLSLEVVPVQGPVSGTRCFLVLFEPQAALKTARGRTRVRAAAEQRASEVLRKELGSTKDYLQSIIEDHEASTEELKAANEEIISSNEELQSTNEELETAKEELQAANEELSTMNEEQQMRNNDLTLANNDMMNLLSSVQLPIVMLGSDSRIRRFTPMAEKVMNLIPADVGRPISDINPKVQIPNLEELVEDVIENVRARELAVRDDEGRRYLLRLRPYKTAEKKIDGAVLLFIDTEAVDKAAVDLSESAQFIQTLLDIVSEPVVLLDAQAGILSANRAFMRAFEGGASVEGRSLFAVADGRLDLPDLRGALKNLGETGRPFSGRTLNAGAARISASGRRLTQTGQPPSFVLALAVEPPGARLS